ncbi:hypothetical protein RRG08_004097 [Elysia crispata]|uniref:Uncharacterized protein n=1 Tax=Elysia crispata TaxID=231223 RepID=A0AAE1AY42_9GAST|nr:hypothetical protein RRG08_004097 [Elysia crispata]
MKTATILERFEQEIESNRDNGATDRVKTDRKEVKRMCFEKGQKKLKSLHQAQNCITSGRFPRRKMLGVRKNPFALADPYSAEESILAMESNLAFT